MDKFIKTMRTLIPIAAVGILVASPAAKRRRADRFDTRPNRDTTESMDWEM